MQEGETFYFQNFFEKAYYCIDTMQELKSQFWGLTTRNVIIHSYVLDNIGQQDAGFLTKKLE